MSERISIAELRAFAERFKPLPDIPPDAIRALVEAVEAAQVVESFLPPLHRAALRKYLDRFDFEDAA